MLYDHKLWIEDIDTVLSVVPEIDTLAGKSIFITGASGLICSAIVDVLFRYNDTHQNKVSILGAGRSFEKMRERFGNMVDRKDFTYVLYDAMEGENSLNVHADYIVHGAGNAFPSLVMKEPVETMVSNVLGVKYLLDYARGHETKRLLYISSSEVYGRKNSVGPFREDDYGYVDLLSERNSYASGKRAAETLCASYAAEYGVESVIVRPGHVYGPTASFYDTRVSSAWPRDAARGRNIVMKSEGGQIRSYCFCLDCASAILKVLLCGECRRAYNISNPNSIISIKEMAEMVANIAGVTLVFEAPDESEKKGFNPMINSSLESESLLKLGWFGCFEASTGFEHTILLMKADEKAKEQVKCNG